MILSERKITYKGRTIFHRTELKPPLRACGKMDDMACFIYILEGEYEALSPHGGIKVGSKEALVKKCGSYIANVQGSTVESVTGYFYPDVLHEMYKFEVPSFLRPAEEITRPKTMVANELLKKFVDGLFIYFDDPALMDDELVLLKLKELIHILLRSEQGRSVHTFLSELFVPDKLQFTTVVENNIFSQMSISELAFICNRSLSSFKREFRQVYNDSPARYIKNKRLDHAQELLCSTKDPISDIAYAIGFQDLSTFSAAFRAKFNTSASKYRSDQNRN